MSSVVVVGAGLAGLAAARRLVAGGHEVTVCAGIGVVERLVGETTYEDLLSCAADLRVRQAKVGDRSRWMAVDLDRACALVRTR